MRSLLGKGKTFLWLDDQEFEFKTLKTLLTKNMQTHHFDSTRAVYLLTDASRHFGIGFALLQYGDKGEPKVITCGSKSLTDTQRRYATIELECMAIWWAVNKCDFYLRGLPNFHILTDHRPLEGIFLKPINDIPNPRLQRYRERLTPYSFTVKWVPGKNHVIADTLSRAPLHAPEEDPDITVDTALTCLTETNDPAIDMVLSSIDEDYRLCAQDILNNTSSSKLSHSLKGLRERLSVEGFLIILDSRRIVIPAAAIPSILSRLHSGHPGQEKTLKLAQSLFYWPGMTNDIRTFVESCKACFRNLPSLPPNPISTDLPSASYGPPMAHVGVDLFEFAGKQFLICVDKWIPGL